jgi:hypothetical protein
MPSVLNVTNLPAPRVPVLDANTGLMTREWYRFFFNLFILAGSGSNTESLQDLQIGPLSADPSVFLNALQDAALNPSGGYDVDTNLVLREAIEGLAVAPPRTDEVPGWSIQPRGVTVGASPFIFQNTTGRSVDLIVTGGAVSAIAFSRDNVTFYGVGLTAGVFWLSPYDYLRVTYTVAPAITLVPR